MEMVIVFKVGFGDWGWKHIHTGKLSDILMMESMIAKRQPIIILQNLNELEILGLGHIEPTNMNN